MLQVNFQKITNYILQVNLQKMLITSNFFYKLHITSKSSINTSKFSKITCMTILIFSQTKKVYTTDNIDFYARRHFYSYWKMYAEQHPDVFH